MTLLEFYNKVNEGFKPNKIKVEGNIYEIDEIEEYSCKENKLVLMDKYNTLDSLNVEVEIIEEDKDDIDLTEIEVYHQYNECLVKDKYYQEQTGTLVDEIIINNLNNLIRYIKKDKED